MSSLAALAPNNRNFPLVAWFSRFHLFSKFSAHQIEWFARFSAKEIYGSDMFEASYELLLLFTVGLLIVRACSYGRVRRVVPSEKLFSVHLRLRRPHIMKDFEAWKQL